MVWTTPITAVSNAVFTAAQWNQSVRDNLLETGPAKATSAGWLLVTNGNHSIEAREIIDDVVEDQGSTTSVTFTTLPGSPGPAVTVTCGRKALVIMEARSATDTAGSSGFAGLAISGNTTLAATIARSIRVESEVADQDYRYMVSDLYTTNPGENTFTMQYRTSTGGTPTSTFRQRRIQVIPL